MRIFLYTYPGYVIIFFVYYLNVYWFLFSLVSAYLPTVPIFITTHLLPSLFHL
jgi:hypothetical protein